VDLLRGVFDGKLRLDGCPVVNRQAIQLEDPVFLVSCHPWWLSNSENARWRCPLNRRVVSVNFTALPGV